MVNILDNIQRNDPTPQQRHDSDTVNKITNEELKMSELLLCLSHRRLASRPLVTTQQFLAQVLKSTDTLMKKVTYTST